MAMSIGNLLHRAIVFSAVGFGVYGTVVITQNLLVKRGKLIELEKEQRAEAEAEFKRQEAAFRAEDAFAQQAAAKAAAAAQPSS